MTDKRDIQISKALSYLLRHGAVKEGLEIDSSGFINLNDILSNNRLKTHKATVEDIKRIVENNDKKRFTLQLRNDEYVICANQGHSLKTVGNENLTLLNSTNFPRQLIHGTTKRNLELILQSGGLKKMNRNHIHFTSKLKNEEDDVQERDGDEANKTVTGIRSFSTILIYLNIDKVIQLNQITFYKSLNDVYLTSGDSEGFLSKDYFDKIVDRETGKLIDF